MMYPRKKSKTKRKSPAVRRRSVKQEVKDESSMDDVYPSDDSDENMSGEDDPNNPEDYAKRRERNNIAVKKSRQKSKQKMAQTLSRVKKLKVENEELENKIQVLSTELTFLKNLFMATASNNIQATMSPADLAALGEEGMAFATAAAAHVCTPVHEREPVFPNRSDHVYSAAAKHLK